MIKKVLETLFDKTIHLSLILKIVITLNLSIELKGLIMILLITYGFLRTRGIIISDNIKQSKMFLQHESQTQVLFSCSNIMETKVDSSLLRINLS